MAKLQKAEAELDSMHATRETKQNKLYEGEMNDNIKSVGSIVSQPCP